MIFFSGTLAKKSKLMQHFSYLPGISDDNKAWK